MKSWVRYGARAGVLAAGLLVVGMTGGQIAQAATPVAVSHATFFDGGDGGDGGSAVGGDSVVTVNGINVNSPINSRGGDATAGNGGDGGDSGDSRRHCGCRRGSIGDGGDGGNGGDAVGGDSRVEVDGININSPITSEGGDATGGDGGDGGDLDFDL